MVEPMGYIGQNYGIYWAKSMGYIGQKLWNTQSKKYDKLCKNYGIYHETLEIYLRKTMGFIRQKV